MYSLDLFIEELVVIGILQFLTLKHEQEDLQIEVNVSWSRCQQSDNLSIKRVLVCSVDELECLDKVFGGEIDQNEG